ncbi:MAG TPA: reverse transcriptase-like protein, partial [Chloroflexia bacterium]|nr:reverse transcriptase-like protein [Chloroflexia bacterium]
GEVAGAEGGSSARVPQDSVIYLGPHEAHTLRNAGGAILRVLVSTPLVVRSNRALGIPAASPQANGRESAPAMPTANTEAAPPKEERARPQVERPARQVAEPPPPLPLPAESPGDEPVPDISGLMKRGSDLVGAPRAERRRPAPPSEPEAQPEAAPPADDDAEAESGLMELSVVFDGGSRGNPGQGYGSYMVQAPGRKPVIKRVEFGDNYTNNQAEYDTLIASLQYIIERLTATGRVPQQVAIDIKSDSDLLVNQVNGQYKVKDAGLRKRHDQAMALLEQFGAWLINWHGRDESVRLLGH